MLLPSCCRDLVGDQTVGGIGVGNPQQGFRYAHQQYTLLGRQIVLLQESVDTPLPRLVLAHGRYQFRRGVADPVAYRFTRVSDIPELIDKRLLVGEIVGVNVRNRAATGKRLPRKKHGYTRLLVSLVLWAS